MKVRKSVADPNKDPDLSDPYVFGILKVKDINSRIRICMQIHFAEQQRHGSVDPDPHQNVMAPQLR
jgi:hypothetical protein